MSTTRVLAVLALLCATGRGISAQTCQVSGAAGSCVANSTATLTAGTVLQLSIGSGSTVVPTPTLGDYDAGSTIATGPAPSVKSNAPWRLQVSSTSALFVATNTDPIEPARVDKPAGDLGWGLSPGGPFTAMTTTATTVVSGTRTAGTSTPIYFSVALSYALDTPGNYSLPLLFSLISP